MPGGLAAEEVRVGITGAFYSRRSGGSPLLPTDASTSLHESWLAHGYLNEDGAVENHDDSSDTVVAWQGATVVRSIRSESVSTLELTALQTRGSTLELYHPGSVVEVNPDNEGEYRIHVRPPTSERRQFCLDVIDGDTLTRIVVANGELQERGETPHANSDPTQYPMTLICYPDFDGYVMRKFSNSSAWAIGMSGNNGNGS